MIGFTSLEGGFGRSYALDQDGKLWHWGNGILEPKKLGLAVSAAQEITGFSFTTPAAIGTVNEASRTISVTVPYGTDVTSLTPTITHTGASISPNSGVSRNFTNPVTYTVSAADGSTKSYTVTVNVAASPTKEITGFNFTTPAAIGTVNEASRTISVTVPYGTDVTSLTPTIVHTGASISPNSGVSRNFTNPVTYTVSAADGSTKSYTVTVNVAASPTKEITDFSFASPAAIGTVNEASRTIAVTVPYGTDVTALTPTITHTGASISPNSGVSRNFTNPVSYTVSAADGSTKSYTVTVNVAASPTKEITDFSFASPAAIGTVNEASRTISVTVPYGTNVTTLTPTITHTGASISPNSGSPRNFTNPVMYTVSAADGSTKSYTVTVNVAVSPTKEITGFSFATPAVTGTVNEASRTIAVTVPYGTDVTALTPTITHTGASISPTSGVPQNFISPVTYTVSAADGSTKSYTVTVSVAASPTKEITGFNFTTPAAIGTVNEASRTLSVTVPYGTDVTSLTPTIVHTGASISPNSGVPRNFTNPVSYTVSAADGSTKSYTVTVNVAASPTKEITSFSFVSPAVVGTVNEASRTISVTVPYGTDVTSLTPMITHTGASISPNSGVSRNFTNPVMYTVSAADGSTKSYTVTVNVAASPTKEITGFSFVTPAAIGTVNEASRTISVTVPYGTNVTALTPTITHTGASISPNSGASQNFTSPVTYTVSAADGSTKSYTVTVNVAASSTKEITGFSFASPAVTGTVYEASRTISVTVPYGTNVTALTPTITHTGASISPNSGASRNFTNPVTYTVSAADGSTKSYTVTVNVAASPTKEITDFSFASPAVAGTVNEASRAISVTVPYGTDVTSLTPTITHTGASISPNSGVSRNFTNPVSYTVSAADGSTKSYTVTVNVAASSTKEITGFSFASPAVTGTVYEASRTISVTVPYGTNVTALTPTITHTGASISPNSGASQNFTNPVSYTVSAADGSTKSYTVTVNVAASPAKEITGFSFATPAVTGTVNEASRTISVTVPYGTNVTSLTPTIAHTGASISPTSGVPQNFTSPVTYTVSAADGSTKSYTVTVNVAASSTKEITGFSFAAPAVTGTVYEASHTIAVTVPFGTDVTSLTPTITHTGASISPNSGVSQNFTSPVSYTVSAADGTTQDYVVTVTEGVQPAPAAPQLLTADGADSQVALNWDTVTGATYYRVYLSTVQGVFPEPASATVTGVTYNMSGLTNGTTYYFIVKAGNSGGLSAASNEAAATPAAAPAAPAAPTQVTAVAGDRQATISFTPPTDNGGSAITSYEVTASSGGVVQSGASSPITVTGLTNGVSYTFTVKAINRAGSSQDSDVSNAVVPSSPSSGEGGSDDNDDNSDNSGNSDTSGTVSEAAVSLADILLNRQAVHGGAAATTDHNRTLLTITADRTKLENRLAAEAQGAVITYRANASFDRVVAEMDGQWVKSMAQKQAVLALETGQATYVLPAQQIDIEALAGKFGESVALQDLKLNIEIGTRVAQDTDRTIKDAVSEGLFTLLAPPVEFSIRATYGDATIEVSKFNTFLEHWIAVPDNVNPDSVTTAVVVEPDGILRYVPLQVMAKENRHYAKASSLTNGSFALVSHSAEFKDMTGHWAEQATREMGARMIVMGTGDNSYEPDREVTRAEFAAILVRGLGLPLERGTAPFSDIPQSAWFNDVVATAYTHRLLNGFEDGTFHPEETITREQAIIMLSRAMTLTGLTAQLPGQAAEEVLRPYTDAAAVSDWALDGMAASIQAGVMQGKSSATLAPQDFLTRAEAATIIQRLLQLSDLI
ncbi:DUF5018 domain-containing protein [Paenibacillus sp. GYB004]|uniref:DUF5018 domain-containing protein n=1 Tax=Paenibacillus sp. GYB004 TaxID=2994393 RepID=UPI002F969ECC